MKKFLALLAALVLVFALSGCGEYTPPEEKPVTPPPIIDDDPGNNDDPDPDDDPFTVTLTYNGVGYNPGSGVYALWNEIGGNGIYRTAFDENGVSRAEGLDGDYRVTLSAIPEGFTYDPNADEHIATNFERNISIILYPLTQTTGGGTHIYTDIITISTIGAYRATLTSRNQVIYYQYAPQTSGDYSMTSMIDITANVLNPILDIYDGSTQYKVFRETRDGGGYSNTFTKNFRWEVGLDRGFIGNIFAFAIRADALSDEAFPVNIDFILDKDDEFSGAKPIEYVPVPVEEEFITVPNRSATMTFNYAVVLQPNKLLDASLFELGEDGYYRFKDGGERLYVKVNSSTQVMDAFTNPLVNKRVKGKDYNEMVSAYASHTNSDGVYPVTEEFKNFLMDYANAQLLFNDGNGFAESSNSGGPGYNSSLESQWLFACGFYTVGGTYQNGGKITDLNY